MTLEQILPPDLINFDRASLESELIQRIKNHPQWSDNYNGLLHHDSLNMVIAIFSFLFGKNAESFDRKLRDIFLQSAVSDEAKIYNLNDKNIFLKQNKESVVTLKCIFTNNQFINDFYIPRFTKLYGTGLNSAVIPFEIIIKDNNEYNYFDDIKITPGQNYTSFTVEAYSGETQRYSYPVNINQEQFDIFVPYLNVIENSIKVYFYLNGIYYELFENKNDNYGRIITDIFPNGSPKYFLKHSFAGQPIITFGTDSFSGKFSDIPEGGEIVIFGRYGGGLNNNIYLNSINETKLVNIDNNTEIEINFTNITQGVGGADGESLDDVIDYAPLRLGRGKQIVDKIDATDALQNLTIKHEIEIPNYEEEKSNNIPMLHNYHYIVPIRSFEGLLFPEILSTYTVEDYENKFVEYLNEFIRIKGTHDSAIVDELVTKFVNNDGVLSFYGILKNKSLLSNSLKLQAYNINDEVIDGIEFEGNYPLNNLIYNKYQNERAIVKSKTFATIEIIVSSSPEDRANNNFKIKFDDHDFLFDISLSSGVYSYEILAEVLDNAIKDQINTYLNPTILGYNHELYIIKDIHDFVSYDTNGLIQILSPKFGKRSQITVIGIDGSAAKNLLDDLNIDVGTTKPKRTKLVFKDENSFLNYSKSEIFCAIDPSDNITENIFDVDIEQDSTSPLGPTFSLVLFDKYLNQNQQLQTGSNILISLMNNTTIVDQVEIPNYSKYLSSMLSTDSSIHTGDCFYDENSIEYITTLSSLNIKLKDPIQSIPYVNGYKDELGIIVSMQLFQIVDLDPLNNIFVQEFLPEQNWEQSVNEEEGPKIILYLDEINKLTLGNTYELHIFTKKDVDPVILSEKILFTNIAAYDTVGVSDVNKISIDIESPIYSRFYNNISIQVVDGVEDNTALPVYHAGYLYFNKVKVNFVKENYSYITCDYKADPYKTESEAKSFTDILNIKNKRLICLENLIKDINFIPVGFTVNLYVKKSYSFNTASIIAYNLLMNSFQYENYNNKHKINEFITQEKIRDVILSQSAGYGITNAILEDNSFKIFNENLDTSKKAYYFVLTDDILILLRELEKQYSNIQGIYDDFKIKINIIPVEN